MTEPQISDDAIELLAQAMSREIRPWRWDQVAHEADRQMWRADARELLTDLVPLLYQQWAEAAATHLEKARYYDAFSRPRKVNGWAAAADELRRFAAGGQQ